MKGLSETRYWRYSILGIFFAAFALIIIGQVARIQVFPAAERFQEQGEIYEREIRYITPARGLIYDRYGRVLAGNKIVYEIGAELQYVRNPQTIAHTLSSILNINYEQVFTAASQPFSSTSVYAVLARGVSEEQKDQIQKIAADYSSYSSGRSRDANPPSLRGLVYRPYLARTYPEGEVASNIIGFVNATGDGFGVEKKFNDLLSGTAVQVVVPLDPSRVSEVPDVPNGTSLILTIDREIQAEMEKILDVGLERTGSSDGALLVMDPKTGEILAMAMTPRMDLNQAWNYVNVFPGGTPFNRAVSGAYEPGSVFKILTMAAGLDSGTVEPDTTFVDTGAINIGGINIYNWNRGAWGPQDMTGCMRHSLNVCLAWLARELGAGTFYNYMDAFGLGRITGIEVAGENPGRLKMPGDEDWYMADLATNSFGQGVSTTPIQMIMAISAVANEGKMVAPHLVRSMVNNGFQYNTPPQVVGTPISAETANTLTNMLVRSLETEASSALVDGYRVAGKTGTAEIPTPYGYSPNMTNASFIGWGPVDDPQFMVYIWLEKPTTSPWGSIVASPLFHDAVSRLVVLMNVPPDNVRFQMSASSSSN
jgi:cell division protein FtsI/penicillin-binding protein 2